MPVKHQSKPARSAGKACAASTRNRRATVTREAVGAEGGDSVAAAADRTGPFWKNQWSDRELNDLLCVLRTQYSIELTPEIEASLWANPPGRAHVMEEALAQLSALSASQGGQAASSSGWKLRTAGTLAEMFYGGMRSSFPSLNRSGDMSSLYLPNLPGISDGFNPDWQSQHDWRGADGWEGADSDAESEGEADSAAARPAVFSVHGGTLSAEDEGASATSEGSRTAWASWLSTWLPAGLAARFGFQRVPAEEAIEMAQGAGDALMGGVAATGRAGRRAGSALKSVALGVGALAATGTAAAGAYFLWWRSSSSDHVSAAETSPSPELMPSANVSSPVQVEASTHLPAKWTNYPMPADQELNDQPVASPGITISPAQISARNGALSVLDDSLMMLENLQSTFRNVSANQDGRSLSGVLGDELVDGQSKPDILKGVLSQMNLTSPHAEDPMVWSPMNPAVLELAEVEVEQLMDDVRWLKVQLAGANASKLTSLNDMLRQLNALKLQGLSQRNWWKSVTFGRIFYGLYELKVSNQYKDLVNGYSNLLSGAQQRLEVEWFSTSFLSQTRQHFESTFGIDANNRDSRVAQQYREWEAKVKANYDVLLTPQNQQKLREFNTFMQTGIDNQAKRAEYKRFLGQSWMTALHKELMSDLAGLPEHVLSVSKYKKFQDRAGARFKELQAGRVMASIPAAMGVPAKILQMVYANATTQQQTLAGFDAFYELLAAMKVPYTFGLQAYDASKNGKSLSVHTGEFFQAYRDAYHSATGGQPSVQRPTEPVELTRFMGQPEHGQGHSFGIEMAKHGELPAAARKHLSHYAKRDPNGWRMINGILGELRNQGPYLAQDALGLILDSYRYGIAANLTATENVAAIFGIISSTAYLEATAADVFLKGPGVSQFVRFANAGGVVTGVMSGISNIAAMAQKGDSQRNIALASIQLIANNAAILGTIAFPVYGTLLAMFIPNFGAIGRAIDLLSLANDFAHDGKMLEAKFAKKLHGLAIADSIPIVNWFSALYTGAVMGSSDFHSDAEADDAVARNFMSELGALQNRTRFAMSESLAGRQVYPARVIPWVVSVPYVQTNPRRTPHRQRNSNQIRRDVSSWVVLKKEPGQYFLTDGQAATKVKVNSEEEQLYWSYPGFTNQTVVRSKLFANRTVASSDHMSDPDRPELFEIAARGPFAPPLVLDNSRSNRPGIYAVKQNRDARLKGGSKNDQFLLYSMPQSVDGGAGLNTVQFVGSAGGNISIDLRKFKNIQTVYGSNNTASVTGSDGADTYIADKQGSANISLGAGDDKAMVMGGNVDMGSGDDMVQALGLPDRLEGGPGTDMVSFENSGLMGFTLNGNRVEAAQRNNATDAPREIAGRQMTNMTAAQVMEMVDAAQSFSDPEHNTLSGFEIIRTTENSDEVTLSTGTEVKWLSLGGGNDTVRLNGVSDIQVLLGSGNDTLISRANGQAYSNLQVRGNGGNNFIDVELNGGKNIVIASGDGNDEIFLRAASGSTNNEATVQTGGGNDKVRIQGDMSLFFRMGDVDGITHVYDDVGRTSPWFVSFGGGLRYDDVSVWTAIDDSGQKDAANNSYAVKVTIRTPGDKTLFVLHTSIAPNLVVTTEKDGQTWIPAVS